MLHAEMEAREATGQANSAQATDKQQKKKAQLLVWVAKVLEDRQLYASALEYRRKALAIREKILGTDHPRIARSCTDIALLLKLQGNRAGAVEYLRKALANAIARNDPDAAIYQRRIDSLTKTNPRS